MAVTHDASECGVLMATASTLEVGAAVTITFHLPPNGEETRTVAGKVVRVEPNPDDPHGIWPNRIAVEFDVPDPELEPFLTKYERAPTSSP